MKAKVQTINRKLAIWYSIIKIINNTLHRQLPFIFIAFESK